MKQEYYPNVPLTAAYMIQTCFFKDTGLILRLI